MATSGRLKEEGSAQEIKIREAETRIETEISALRTAIQASKVCRRSFGACDLTYLALGYNITISSYIRYLHAQLMGDLP